MFTFTHLPSSAQQQPYAQLTIAEGLSQGMIYDIMQDKEGFIWIATKDGLNRYDGYEFESYSYSPSAPYSISDDIVKCLMEDDFGRLWVGTMMGGINLFDRRTERFYQLRPESPNAKEINAIVQQNDSVFWLATNEGLDRLVVPTGNRIWPEAASTELDQEVRFSNYAVDGKSSKVDELLLLDDKQLIASCKRGIYIIDPSNPDALRPFHQSIGIPKLRTPNSFYRLNRLPGGGLAIASNQDFYLHSGDTLKHIPLPAGTIESWGTLHVDGKGNIWLGNTNTLFKIKPDAPDRQQLKPVVQFDGEWLQTTLFTDRDGLVWIGTNGYGVRVFNPRVTNFNHQLESRSTRQLYIDRQERLWVWQNRQMQVLDPQTGRLYFPAGFPTLARHSNYMLNSADGSYWFRLNIIELGRRLIRYHPNTGTLAFLPYDCITPSSFPMAMDASGRVWMPCQNSQIALFTPGQTSPKYIDLSTVFPEGYMDLKIYALRYLPEQDAFWAGTQYGLVYMKLREDGGLESQYYRRKKGAEHNPLSDRILCLESAKDGKLWVGTRGGGFSLFDPATGHFNNYTTEDGLPNQVVYGIQKDKAGRLWISTNRGLSCYYPNEGRFRNFTARDGLQADEFNSLSYTKAPDGRLLFGGVNGINSFYPDDVQGRMAAPNVMITGIDVNSEPLDSKKDTAIVQNPVPQVREIQLAHYQNVLTLRFAALQYANPSKHRYRYLMVGVDNQVKTMKGTREVTYAHLQPGQYVFKVWGSSQGGQWSEQPTTLRIDISPPWWRTVWAYIVYAVLLGGAIYFAYRFQVRRATLRNQLAYEQREAERLAELDRLKSDFFSNITHEFRTPLTLIQEPARQLLDNLSRPEERSMAYLIAKNARKLLQLVNQLLDISKIEAGAMPVRYKAGNLYTLLQETGGQFQEYARQKGIKLDMSCQGEESDYDGQFDKDKLEKIVANLLSNAIKFTPKGGYVNLRCARRDGDFLIEVADNGIGIPESEQTHIFERFYQVKSPDNITTGTGIGLALSKELAAMLGGSLRLDSQVGRGTTFRIRIPARPLDPIAFSPASQQFVEQLSPKPTTATAPFSAADRGLKVLIVEDQTDLRRFIRSVLGGHFQIEEAEHGREGLERAVQEMPDLVVSDVMMPIMDGFELTQRLKTDERTSHIPIVLLSAKSALESRLEGFSQGADAYLEKPFHSEELRLRIHQLINLRKHLQEKYSQSQDAGSKSDMPEMEKQFLEKLETCLEERLSDPKLNAEELARLNHLSRSQLHRKLKAITGNSTSAFIRNYRLERGRVMLLEGISVSEVSLKVGFSTPQYFSTRFKKKFGFPPSSLQDAQQ